MMIVYYLNELSWKLIMLSLTNIEIFMTSGGEGECACYCGYPEDYSFSYDELLVFKIIAKPVHDGEFIGTFSVLHYRQCGKACREKGYSKDVCLIALGKGKVSQHRCYASIAIYAPESSLDIK